MASGFTYKSGPYELQDKGTTASSAIAVGDPIMASSGLTVLLTTSNKCVGVQLGTKAVGSAATTVKQSIKVYNGRTVFEAFVKSGTLATTEDMSLIDFTGSSGATGIAADTTTNGDLYIEKVVTAATSSASPQGEAKVKFSDPSYLNATN